MEIIVEGLSKEQVQKDIERMTKGWKLFFEAPTGASYEFINSFWGASWNGEADSLRDIILKHIKIGGHLKKHLLIFTYNGKDRFVWCSWTREVYDCNTGIKHQLEGNELARKITELVKTLL